MWECYSLIAARHLRQWSPAGWSPNSWTLVSAALCVCGSKTFYPTVHKQSKLSTPLLQSVSQHQCAEPLALLRLHMWLHCHTPLKHIFADDTTVAGLIANNNETACRDEVCSLTRWCTDNNLTLIIKKTQEIILDFRKNKGQHSPLTINGEEPGRVSLKFSGTHISENLTWSVNTTALVKKGSPPRSLLFEDTFRKTNMSAELLKAFHHCSFESVLTYSITACYANCTEADIKTFKKVIGLPLSTLDHIFKARCRCKTSNILKDDIHPSHLLFPVLPSGRCYRIIKARTSRLKNSFRAELY